MCFSAIPGQNGHIRAVREFPRPLSLAISPPTKLPPVTLRTITRPHPVRVYSGLRVPMCRGYIYHECCRRERLTEYQRGKRIAKRTHKPDWHGGYEKY